MRDTTKSWKAGVTVELQSRSPNAYFSSLFALGSQPPRETLSSQKIFLRPPTASCAVSRPLPTADCLQTPHKYPPPMARLASVAFLASKCLFFQHFDHHKWTRVFRASSKKHERLVFLEKNAHFFHPHVLHQLKNSISIENLRPIPTPQMNTPHSQPDPRRLPAPCLRDSRGSIRPPFH